ncbi:MAG TPA: DUF1634 domain-containing protein [Terriglobia bacterium]|nr:DUF1634 domain-containing protein [Terriglobia bacterium]
MRTSDNSQGTADDEQFEQVIATLLICGVIAAAAVVMLGGIVYLARHGGEVPNYHRFQGSYHSVRGILRDVLAGRGRGLIQLGILMLIATPVARVALSLIAFLRHRDFLYTLFTLIVLAVLVLSLLGRRL